MSAQTTEHDGTPTCPQCGTELEPYGDDGAQCPNDDCRWVQTRGYEGPAIDGRMSPGPWANDGETVEGTPREDPGEISSENWPNALPRDEFTDKQAEIVRFLSVHPDASLSQIDANVDSDGNYHRHVRKKVAAIVDSPDDVNFDIPFQEATVESEGAGSENDEESLQRGAATANGPSEDGSGMSEQTLEVLGRIEVLGQDPSTIAEEMGISEHVVNGSKNAARFVDESQYIVPDVGEGDEDDATDDDGGFESRATDESEKNGPEAIEDEERDQGAEPDPETAHTTSDEPSDSTGGNDELTDAFLGGVVAAILLWIGYRIGRWRAGGDGR